jgi:hypothetical protein
MVSGVLGAALMALPLSAAAQVPEPPAAPEPASGDQMGGYRAVETDSAPVLEARAVIQKELAVMRISQVDLGPQALRRSIVRATGMEFC